MEKLKPVLDSNRWRRVVVHLRAAMGPESVRAAQIAPTTGAGLKPCDVRPPGLLTWDDAGHGVWRVRAEWIDVSASFDVRDLELEVETVARPLALVVDRVEMEAAELADGFGYVSHVGVFMADGAPYACEIGDSVVEDASADADAHIRAAFPGVALDIGPWARAQRGHHAPIRVAR